MKVQSHVQRTQRKPRGGRHKGERKQKGKNSLKMGHVARSLGDCPLLRRNRSPEQRWCPHLRAVVLEMRTLRLGDGEHHTATERQKIGVVLVDTSGVQLPQIYCFLLATCLWLIFISGNTFILTIFINRLE